MPVDNQDQVRGHLIQAGSGVPLQRTKHAKNKNHLDWRLAVEPLSCCGGGCGDFVGEAANGTGDVWRMCGDGVDYPRLSWEFSQGGDMICPNGVGIEDLQYFAWRWTDNTPASAGAADINSDGKVDMADLAILSAHWLQE
jgi:hypothetical protein